MKRKVSGGERIARMTAKSQIRRTMVSSGYTTGEARVLSERMFQKLDQEAFKKVSKARTK